MSGVKCPLCGKPLGTRLIADFWLCRDCEVAVRCENDMPLKKIDIYNQDWVKAQEESKYILRKSRYLATKIKELRGVRCILDIGCGTGILVDILSQGGYITTGIDSSSNAIEVAKSHRQGNFVLASVECFQSERKYDLIVAAQLIEHLREPRDFLAKVRTLLKPEGYPNLKSWSKRSLWRRRIGGMFYGTDHRICYTPRSLTRLLCDHGFNIYKVITKRYSPTVFVELMSTFFSTFRDKPRESLHGDSVQSHSLRNALKKIYGPSQFSVGVSIYCAWFCSCCNIALANSLEGGGQCEIRNFMRPFLALVVHGK